MKKILLAIAITILVSPTCYARYRTAGSNPNEGHYERQRNPSYQRSAPTRSYYPRTRRGYYPQQPRYYQEPAVTVAPQRFFRD
jgi:hypothetical protein